MKREKTNVLDNHKHKLMTRLMILANNSFETSEVGLSNQQKEHCERVSSQDGKQIETKDPRNYWKNLTNY